MPFGLSCAPATFQRLKDLVLAGLQWSSCLVYLDDVCVFTKGDAADHLRDLTDLFSRLREQHLRAQPSKCARLPGLHRFR